MLVFLFQGSLQQKQQTQCGLRMQPMYAIPCERDVVCHARNRLCGHVCPDFCLCIEDSLLGEVSWKFMYFENTVCSLGTLANYLLIELKIELKIILKNYKT